MRLLVCGGRDFVDKTLIFETLDSLHAEHPISWVIQGAARGVSRCKKAHISGKYLEMFENELNPPQRYIEVQIP